MKILLSSTKPNSYGWCHESNIKTTNSPYEGITQVTPTLPFLLCPKTTNQRNISMWQKKQPEVYQTELLSFSHTQVFNNPGRTCGHLFLLLAAAFKYRHGLSVLLQRGFSTCTRTLQSFNQLFPTANLLQWDNTTSPGHCMYQQPSTCASLCTVYVCLSQIITTGCCMLLGNPSSVSSRGLYRISQNSEGIVIIFLRNKEIWGMKTAQWKQEPGLLRYWQAWSDLHVSPSVGSSFFCTGVLQTKWNEMG